MTTIARSVWGIAGGEGREGVSVPWLEVAELLSVTRFGRIGREGFEAVFGLPDFFRRGSKGFVADLKGVVPVDARVSRAPLCTFPCKFFAFSSSFAVISWLSPGRSYGYQCCAFVLRLPKR